MVTQETDKCPKTDGNDTGESRRDGQDSTRASPSPEENQNGDDSTGKDEADDIRRREQEWRNMANGICLLFDQALPFRLIYPCEQSQLAALEQANNLPPSQVYGCEHFLRLLVQLPSLLDDTYKPMDESELDLGAADDFDDLVKPILAKMNDLCRFLVKGQGKYFPQRFRKKSEDEIKLEQKWAKKRERQRAAAAAAADSPSATNLEAHGDADIV